MTIRARTPLRGAEALYALAFLGANLAFLPLLVLLVPRRVAGLAGDHAVVWLSQLVLLGGVVASLAHVAAGALSDLCLARWGDRRPVIALGLAGLLLAYALLAYARTPVGLAAGMVAFQTALNLMFAPLGALMADYVPDSRKGRVAGWLNAALPTSSLLVAALTRFAPVDGPMGFSAVAALFSGLIAPLLVLWPFSSANVGAPEAAPATRPLQSYGDLFRAGAARLLMQFGGALMVNYLFLYLAGLERRHMPGLGSPTAAIGILSLIASLVAIITALIAGHGSDFSGRRKPGLILSALIAAAALAALTQPRLWLVVVLAYGAQQASLSAYLTIDAALVGQLLSNNPRRGVYLGLMNLTNTLPGIVMAALALTALERGRHPDALLGLVWVSALASGLAAWIASRIRTMA